MKKILIILCFIGVIGIFESKAQITTEHWYLPTMSLEQAHQLKGYDEVIVDPEVIFNNRASLDALRLDNKNVKIYCYFNVVEWFNPMFDDKPWSKNIVAFLNKHEEWFLHGGNGERISFWPGMQTMNCAINCPGANVYSTEADEKINYINFISERFIDDILKTYHFDGVVTDNLWPKIDWIGYYGVNQSGLDYGIAKDDSRRSEILNEAWRAGMSYCLNQIKKFDPSLIIIGNPGNMSYPQCSGKMFENFPEIYLNEADTIFEAWYENISNASMWPLDKNIPAGHCIFNARKNNYFFTLCSSMLLNGVSFSYLQNTKYEEKYKLNLGSALGPSKISNGIYTRSYEKGIVMVDPYAKKSWVVYQDGRTRKE